MIHVMNMHTEQTFLLYYHLMQILQFSSEDSN